MAWYSDCKRIAKQEVIGNLADVRILVNRLRPRLFSIRCTDLRDTPMIGAVHDGYCEFLAYRLVEL